MNKKFIITIENAERKIARRELKVSCYASYEKEPHYGTGLYIRVFVDGFEHAYLDCRYETGSFKELCENYIRNYWGNNLKEIREIA